MSRWTKKEIALLKKYAHLPIAEQAQLLDRKETAIRDQRSRSGIAKSRRPTSRRDPWTDEEEQFLIDNYIDMTDEEMGQEIQRSAGAVRTRRSKLQLRRTNVDPWTDEELEFIQHNHHDYTNQELGDHLGRQPWVILSMKKQLDLTQDQKQWTQEEETFLANHLHLTDKELADQLDTTPSSIDNKRGRLGLSKENMWSVREETFVTNNYEKMSDGQLANKLDRTIRSIRYKRMHLNLLRMEQDSHDVNEDFFKAWTPEMAYILGFIFGDGYVNNQTSGYQLVFTSTDRSLLKKIRSAMDCTNPIRTRSKRKTYHKDKHTLTIHRKEIVKDLDRLGVVQAKSRIMSFPHIPDPYFYHFVRGFFDADGHVNHRSGLYILFVSASEKFTQGLSNELDRRGIDHSVYFQENEYNGIYQLYIKKKKRRQFVTNLYHNSTIHLQRKKDIFDHYYNDIIMIECHECGVSMERMGSNHKHCEDCVYSKKLAYDRAYHRQQASTKHGRQENLSD